MNAIANTDAILAVIDWATLDETQRRDALSRPRPIRDKRQLAAVRAILADVRARGDTALRELTARLDGCDLASFEVDADEFAVAETEIGIEVRAAMRNAIARVEMFHAAQVSAGVRVDTAPGVCCEQVIRPIGRVGLYAPAGSAPLPSTVWMLAVPARIAGCAEIVLATPPRRDGRADPAILVAAKLCGVARVLKLGGAQAIAALAYGTESVPRCDKLFGPGNAWVTAAKLEIAADPEGAAIDMPAGPSEVLVIADDSADPAFVAADLLAQAEHGADSQVLLLSPSTRLLDAVARAVATQVAELPRRDIACAALAHARLIRVSDLAEAVAISERYAPEHLIVQTREPRALLAALSNAGSIFLGAWSPETVGDYCAGPNHVLPTLGFARSFSGVGVDSFVRRVNVQELSAEGLRNIGGDAALLARTERLEAHARAVDLRLHEIAQREHHPHPTAGHPALKSPVCTSVCSRSPARGSAARKPGSPIEGEDQAGEHMSLLARTRPDLASFQPYMSARKTGLDGRIRLNANESPWAGDGAVFGMNRYPDPQPEELRARLAALYEVPGSRLWIGRGSDEPIDLLLRAFCRAGRDNVVATAPTFGMYRIGAQVQGTEYRALALSASEAFAFDPERLLALTDADTKIVFVCSPNNPTGTLHHAALAYLAERLAGRALLLVDEAYIEFADVPSATALIDRHDNIAVLRTLSKVHALAGVRIGTLIAHADIAAFVAGIAAPYPLPSPCVALALATLQPTALECTRQRIATLIAERARVTRALATLADVREIWPSSANFVLARFGDGNVAFERALAAGIVLRDVSAQLGLDDCLRITIGAPEENDAMLAALDERDLASAERVA